MRPLATLSYAVGGLTRSNGTPSIGGHAGLSAGGTAATQSLIWGSHLGNDRCDGSLHLREWKQLRKLLDL